MKARTLLSLLSLSSNIYLMSKDRELRNKLNAVLANGKSHHAAEAGDNGQEESEEQLFDRLGSKLEVVRQELERQLEQLAIRVYRRMHIAHRNETRELREQLSELRKSVTTLEAQLGTKTKKKGH